MSNRFSAWFDGPTTADLQVEMSHYRFVYAGVPRLQSEWEEIKREFAAIMAGRSSVQEREARCPR